MGSTLDCSNEISREHYVSDGLLKKFPDLLVSGMPWQKPGEAEIYPRNALVAKILCKRHNSALAPLDTLVVGAFDAFMSAAAYAVSRAPEGNTDHYLISGQALELWMLKLAAGIHFGGIAAADGAVLRDTCNFPVAEIVEALSGGRVPFGSGLFATQSEGLVQAQQIRAWPMIDEGSNTFFAVGVQLGTLNFETTLIRPPVSFLHQMQMAPRRRPGIIDFIGPARDARVILTWKTWLNEVRRLGLNVIP